MACKIWRLDVHSAKQNINLEKFIDDIQKENGDVTNIKAIQIKTVRKPSANSAVQAVGGTSRGMIPAPQDKESIATATIVAVFYTPFGGAS